VGAQLSTNAPPPLDPEETRWVVLVAHQRKKLAEWRATIEADTRLVNATIDWRFGDVESALGAAAHMGFREHARFLLDLGARLDLFAAATLGYLDVVKTIVKFEPDAPFRLGPHGVTLIAHARNGGSSDVEAYLQSIGAGDGKDGFTTRYLDRYVGKYTFRNGGSLRIANDNGALRAVVNGDTWRLTHVRSHVWSRADNDLVRLSFRMNGVSAWGAQIAGAKKLEAIRVIG